MRIEYLSRGSSLMTIVVVSETAFLVFFCAKAIKQNDKSSEVSNILNIK
jgi:hypothetical protein